VRPAVRGPQAAHHHGPLAGLGAGAAAVLVAMVLVLAVWHRVSGAIADAVLAVAWAVMLSVAGLVIAAAVYTFLWLRHRARHPAALSGRQLVTAEVITPQPQAVTAPAAAAIEPPREVHLHFHTADPAEAAEIIRTALPGTAGDAITEGNGSQ
jgi:hypothetical protein